MNKLNQCVLPNFSFKLTSEYRFICLNLETLLILLFLQLQWAQMRPTQRVGVLYLKATDSPAPLPINNNNNNNIVSTSRDAIHHT